MIKTTYSLDLQSAGTLEKLANVWETSKSNVIRRLVREAWEKLESTSPEFTNKSEAVGESKHDTSKDETDHQ